MYRDKIIKLLDMMTYKHDTYKVFGDFIEMLALEILLSILPSEKCIKTLETTSKIYDEEDIKIYNQFKKLIVGSVEENPFQDLLGDIFSELNIRNKVRGQFFTPYHLSKTIAIMSVGDLKEQLKHKDLIRANEPACGSGGMVIAICEEANRQAINYSAHISFEMYDVDLRCVYMSYIQTSLAGISAKIFHRNTLTMETWSIWHTPSYILNDCEVRISRLNKIEKMKKILARPKQAEVKTTIEEIETISKEIVRETQHLLFY